MAPRMPGLSRLIASVRAARAATARCNPARASAGSANPIMRTRETGRDSSKCGRCAWTGAESAQVGHCSAATVPAHSRRELQTAASAVYEEFLKWAAWEVVPQQTSLPSSARAAGQAQAAACPPFRKPLRDSNCTAPAAFARAVRTAAKFAQLVRICGVVSHEMVARFTRLCASRRCATR